jgi:hypothetical protein
VTCPCTGARRSSAYLPRVGTFLNKLPHRRKQLLRAALIQLQAGLLHRSGNHAVVRSRAGDLVDLQALHGTPAAISEAKKGDRRVHWVFGLPAIVHGGEVGEVL